MVRLRARRADMPRDRSPLTKTKIEKAVVPLGKRQL
jgi:hypothetical protein